MGGEKGSMRKRGNLDRGEHNVEGRGEEIKCGKNENERKDENKER